MGAFSGRARWLIVALAWSASACGSSPPPPSAPSGTVAPEPSDVASDPEPGEMRPPSRDLTAGAPPASDAAMTPLRTRQHAACRELGPRLTRCAIEDALRTMTKAEVAKLDLEATAPQHTRDFVDKCQAQQLSSRQVRVYEVCLRAETRCRALLDCLDHAQPGRR